MNLVSEISENNDNIKNIKEKIVSLIQQRDEKITACMINSFEKVDDEMRSKYGPLKQDKNNENGV
jgi:uncharacterized coiled-coil DUF342 family protein